MDYLAAQLQPKGRWLQSRSNASIRREVQAHTRDTLSALIYEPSFKQTAGEAMFGKARMINTRRPTPCRSPRLLRALYLSLQFWSRAP
jgi:hypothetical protein